MIFIIFLFISFNLFSLQLEINLKNGDFPFDLLREEGYWVKAFKISDKGWLVEIWQDSNYFPAGEVYQRVLKKVREVKNFIEYNPYHSSIDFEEILTLRKGNCITFSSFLETLLKREGFLAQQVSGILFSKEKNNPFYISKINGTAHRWVKVFFPEYGWLSFDPLSETGRITSFHLPLKSPALLNSLKEIEIKVLQWDS
ncbi:MAG: transglutaminase-like domain-containing protein [Thermoanaerobaculia bacterium]